MAQIWRIRGSGDPGDLAVSSRGLERTVGLGETQHDGLRRRRFGGLWPPGGPSDLAGATGWRARATTTRLDSTRLDLAGSRAGADRGQATMRAHSALWTGRGRTGGWAAGTTRRDECTASECAGRLVSARGVYMEGCGLGEAAGCRNLFEWNGGGCMSR
ncbi:hypothetical protein CERSUDRAFT_101505 [Gelatoporia subvermispora B]|uniref:Uncharacterized protein n=1 Tax=Ceriporiopsis subvermispora (strain B) TaxID=914234 RepID=M2P557_CERS8|nr:hypothetical protein CERSUDRAFT_101505 [Gelatoporia subvermispora B]